MKITFDCYCKRVLRNAANDYYEELGRRRLHETPFDLEWVHPSTYDVYPYEEHVYDVFGVGVPIRDNAIIHALDALTETARTIVLAAYCVGLSDRAVAEQLGMVRRTVTYRKARTLSYLREVLSCV